MKLRELGAGIILTTMIAPVVVVAIGWASAQIVSLGERTGVIEIRVDSVEQKEERIYQEVKEINKKIDRLLERE